MSNHRIDWIVHRAVSAASGLLIRRRRDDGSLETFRSLLQERGFQVRELSLKDMSIERADTAVHVVHGLPPQELSMLLEQRQHASSLWIVRDEDQERIVLSALDRRHDAARLGTHPESLVARVLRLQVQEHMDVTVATALDRDRLTGLMDRRAFGRVLRREIANLLPGDQKALLHLDVDGFKRINDYFGHHVADKTLCGIAERLREAAAPDDQLARIGGDEFVVLFSRASPDELLRDAERLRQAVSTDDVSPGHDDIALTASAGLTLLRPGLTEPQLYFQADSAAIEAKAQGRNRLTHFELIQDSGATGPEADLQRFQEITRMISDRMSRMVSEVGEKLVESARTHALRDPLTGARNRGFFNERLPREMERARVLGRPLCLALLDIDHFHDVNAQFGFTSGDAVLQRFVLTAAKSLRPPDWLARYGGEEFAVVLPDTDLEDAVAVAERLRSTVESTEFVATDGRRIRVTVSIGVTQLAADSMDAVGLCAEASKACLQAKDTGRNSVISIP